VYRVNRRSGGSDRKNCVALKVMWLASGSTVIKSNKNQLVATLCRFYFCRVTLHVSGASAHHQEYLKLIQRPLVHVLS